ncbi:vascular endothelial growth factor A [Sarotherodon galilaeus]
MRPTQDDNNELFSWKMITKQPELRHPEGDSKAEQNTNPMENGNQKRFAYVLQTRSTHKTDIHDFNEKQMLSDVGEEALIMFFLPEAEMETQTDPRSERKHIPNPDFRWKVNIPELGDLPPITKALKDIAIKQYDSKCKCLKGRICLLEIFVIESLARKAVEPGKTIKEQVKETTEKPENSKTTNIYDETTRINHTEHEGNLKPEETVVPSPPPLKMITTEHITDTTTANTKIKDTTISTEVITQSSAHEDDGQPSAEKRPTTGMSPEPEAHTEQGLLKNETETTQATTVKPFSGLRMREDVLENLTKFLKGAESEEEALKSRTETERKEDQNDPRVGSFTFSTHLDLIHTEPPDKHAKVSGDTVPLCGGLIHRTKAGWKHCKERLGGTKMFASRHPMVPGELQTDPIRDDDNSRRNDEENDHFYYFNGVLKRVQNNFYPHYKRETHSGVPTERQKRDTRENLLSYILRLTLRNRGQ